MVESLVDKWDPTIRIFRFRSINFCLTIEEYFLLLGVHYNTNSIITPPPNQGSKARMSKVLGIQRNVFDQKGGTNECTLKFLCNLFANPNAYQKNSSTFRFSYEERKQNHVLAISLFWDMFYILRILQD